MNLMKLLKQHLIDLFLTTEKIDIEQLIDTVEDLPKGSSIDVEYDDTNLSWCKLIVKV